MYTFKCNVMYVKNSYLIHVIIPDFDKDALITGMHYVHVAVNFIAYVLFIEWVEV